MHVEIYSDLRSMPSYYDQLFEEAGEKSFYSSRPWFDTLINEVRGADENALIFGLETHARPRQAVAALVARYDTSAPLYLPNCLFGFSTIYSTIFSPIIAPGYHDRSAVARHFASALEVAVDGWDSLRFDAMDRVDPFFFEYVNELQSHGYWVQPFFHFGNAFETTRGLTFDDYLRRRSSKLRNTLARRQKKIEKSGAVSVDIIAQSAKWGEYIEAYNSIYAKSWKEPEPFPDFVPKLVNAAASVGALRFGLLSLDGEAAAAQIWIVSGDGATIFKLAHDDSYKDLSPGSLLTARMMRHVIETDEVPEVDFGRGDDPYKALWLSQRRERWGLMAYNKRTPKGTIFGLSRLGSSSLKGLGKKLIRNKNR